MTSKPLPVIQAKATAALPASEALSSRWISLFTALCFLCVALGFSYLDRRYGYFKVESIFWVGWAGTAFLVGSVTLGSKGESGKNLAFILTAIAALLAILPAFFMYELARWICVVLLLVISARAPMMHTRRDLYLCLTTCFSVSFMAATHHRADWTLWLYMGPAWIFAGLALTWDYAADKSIGHGTRLGMNLGFVGITAGLALLLFLFVPRPPVLGFGFIPPAADAPGLWDQPAGPSGADAKGASAQGTGKGGGAGNAQGQGSGGGAGGGGGGSSPGDGQGGGLRDKWDGMLKQMRPALKDPAMPAWQRNLLGKLLDWAQFERGDGEPHANADAQPQGQQQPQDSASGGPSWPWTILLALLALVLGWLLHKFRYWLGIEAMHIGARLLARHFPERSMRMSAQAMKWCLMDKGHKPLPGQSLREYLDGVPGLPKLSRRWFGYALALYNEMRFGTLAATSQRANHMREAVAAATQLVKGHAPELSKP
jgi:uncharacterized membrane protein YgcG